MSESLLASSSAEEILSTDVEIGEKAVPNQDIDALEQYLLSAQEYESSSLDKSLGENFRQKFPSLYPHLKNDVGRRLFDSIVYYQAFERGAGRTQLFPDGDNEKRESYSIYINRLDTILASHHHSRAWLRVW